ncbi:MAG: hypothetical protein ACRCSK_06890 [Fusobacteriaceae bacterium]
MKNNNFNNNFKKFLNKGIIPYIIICITSVLLFFMAVSFPLFGAVLLIYKIEKITILRQQEISNKILIEFLINLVIILLVGFAPFMSPEFLTIYAGYLLLEYMFYLFQKKIRLDIFDRIAVSGVIGGIFLGLAYYFVLKYNNMNFDSIKQTYIELFSKSGISSAEITKTFDTMQENIYVFIAGFAYVINYFVYWKFYKAYFLFWRISYLWIIIYIILFGLKYFYKYDNIYVRNILEFMKLIYIPAGIKFLYVNIFVRFNHKFIGRILLILLLIYFPLGLFVFGVYDSLRHRKSDNENIGY